MNTEFRVTVCYVATITTGTWPGRLEAPAINWIGHSAETAWVVSSLIEYNPGQLKASEKRRVPGTLLSCCYYGRFRGHTAYQGDWIFLIFRSYVYEIAADIDCQVLTVFSSLTPHPPPPNATSDSIQIPSCHGSGLIVAFLCRLTTDSFQFFSRIQEVF